MNLTLEYEDNKKQEIPSDTSSPHCSGRADCRVFKWEVKLQRKGCFCKKIPRYVWTRPKIQRKYMTWLSNWLTLTCAGVNSTPLSVQPTPFVSSFAAHVWCFLFFSRPSGSSIDLNCLSRRTRENTSCSCVYEFGAEMNAATCVYHVWASAQPFRHCWWKSPSSTSLSTFRTAITRLLHWAQHYPDRRRRGRRARASSVCWSHVFLR